MTQLKQISVRSIQSMSKKLLHSDIFLPDVVCLIIICMFSETSLMTRTSCIFITLGISSCPEVIPKVTNIHPIVNRQCHSICTHQIENWNQTDPNNKSDNTTRRDISHICVIRVIFCSCVID